LQTWLTAKRGRSVTLAAPQRGEKKHLVGLANENAREALAMMRVKWMADKGKTLAALEELRDELDLPSAPRRIECYDISHTQGTNQVASMVVFVDGRPLPSEYRRFKIKHTEGNNDVLSMTEVLQRRFKRAKEATNDGEEDPARGGWGVLPDLLLIDGGKPQLGAALDVLRDMRLGDVPVAGLAKENEEIYVADTASPTILPRTSQALYLIQRIRDEAHRFAITFHRQVRAKSSIKSALDEIPGVGPRRKQALIRRFGSVRGIREASVDEIAGTDGINLQLAERLKSAL